MKRGRKGENVEVEEEERERERKKEKAQASRTWNVEETEYIKKKANVLETKRELTFSASPAAK